jgi:hypothetical protein
MKVSKIKQIIKEEVASVKMSLTELAINNEFSLLKKKASLHESLLGSLASLFLDSKYKKKAEQFKDSPEYKELIHQMEMSTKSLNYLTAQLKDKIDDYEKGFESMQKAGVKVKIGMSPKAIWKEYERWKANMEKESGKHKAKLINMNPEWEKILK